MSNTQRELSNEILKIIFLYLQKRVNSKRTLGQCALTCRGWRFVAQSLIFYSLKLKNEKDIEDINRMILHNCMIEQWTRRLSIEFIVSKPSSLIAIDKLLPRIEELSLPPPVYYGKGKIEPQRLDSAYSFLYELLAKDNKFNNLRILPIPVTVNQRKLYVECLYVIRNRITDMKIYDVDNDNRLLYANLYNNLHLFPHLKSVWASVENNMSLDIVEYCESLLTKENLSSVFLQDLTIQIIDSSYVNSSTLLEQDNIFPASNIKSVAIYIYYKESEHQHLEELGDKLMIYIMKKFPDLNSLELIGDYAKELTNLNRIKRVPLLENEGPNRIKQLDGVICQFLNYIYKIPNCCLQDFIVPKECTIQMIQELSKGITSSNSSVSGTYITDDNWEEASFITLDATISPEYSEISACMHFH